MPSPVATSDCRLSRRSPIITDLVWKAFQVPSASSSSHMTASAAQSLVFSVRRFMVGRLLGIPWD